MQKNLNILLRIMIIIMLVLSTCLVGIMGVITFEGFTSCNLQAEGYTPALLNRYAITTADDHIIGLMRYNGLQQMLYVSNPETGELQIAQHVDMLDDFTVTTSDNDVVTMYTDIEICWSQLWVRQHRPRMEGESDF